MTDPDPPIQDPSQALAADPDIITMMRVLSAFLDNGTSQFGFFREDRRTGRAQQIQVTIIASDIPAPKGTRQ